MSVDAERIYDLFGLSEEERSLARELGEQERDAREEAERRRLEFVSFLADRAKSISAAFNEEYVRRIGPACPDPACGHWECRTIREFRRPLR